VVPPPGLAPGFQASRAGVLSNWTMEAKVARTAGVAPALGVLEALTLYRVVRMERDVGVAPTHSAFAERCLTVLANPSNREKS
jgi:hypothetical protein